jgi:hypothetical protein
LSCRRDKNGRKQKTQENLTANRAKEAISQENRKIFGSANLLIVHIKILVYFEI